MYTKKKLIPQNRRKTKKNNVHVGGDTETHKITARAYAKLYHNMGHNEINNLKDYYLKNAFAILLENGKEKNIQNVKKLKYLQKNFILRPNKLTESNSINGDDIKNINNAFDSFHNSLLQKNQENEIHTGKILKTKRRRCTNRK